MPTRVGRGGRVGLAVLHGGGGRVRRVHGRLGGVQVGLLLELADVLLVPDALVAEPVGYLRERSRTERGGAGGGRKRRRRRSRGVRRQAATRTVHTERCDCFKMSCLGPSSTQFPAPAVMSAGYTS